MLIARLQIYSRMGMLPFMYIYSSDSKREEMRKAINLTFKKASYINIQAPSECVENYLYGMSFEKYCVQRLRKTFASMELDQNVILNAIKNHSGTVRNRKSRPVD